MKSLIFILVLLGVILLPSIVLSQVKDSLLALEYYEKARSFRGGNDEHLTIKQKSDSSYHYYMLAFPLLHKAHIWDKLISSSHNIAKYKKAQNEDAAGFLFNLLDTLKYYKVNQKIENIYIQLGTFDKENKTEYYNTALGIVMQRGDSASTARFLKILGDWYLQQDSIEQATNCYKRALQIRKQIKLPINEIYSVISKLYKFTGDFGIALQYLDSAFTQTDNVMQRATYINDMGSVYNHMGDFEKALNYAEMSIKLRMTSQYPGSYNLVRLYTNIATVLNAKGDYQKSNEYLEQALTTIKQHNRISRIVEEILKLKIYNLLELNEPGKALNYLPHLNSCLKKFHRDTSVVLNLYGSIYYQLGNYDSSLAYFNLAGASTYNYAELGDLYFKLNDFEKSREYYNKRITLFFPRKEVHPLSILMHKQIGDTYFAEGKIDSAMICYKSVLKLSGIDTTYSNEQILEIAERKDLDMIIHDVFRQLARIHKIYYKKNNSLQELKDTHKDFTLASELLNNYKLLLDSEKSKLFWSEKTSGFYDEAIDNALYCASYFSEEKYLNDAFQLIEMSKGHILKGSINESAAIKMSDIPDSLRIVEQNFREKINSVKLFRRKELQEENPNPQKISYLDNELFTLKRDYSYLIKNFEKHYPEYFRLKYQTNTISIPELQQKLNSNESVLQYYLGRNQLIIIIINKDSVYSCSSQIDSVFHIGIQRFLGQLRKGNLIRNKNRTEFIDLSNYLYQILFAPISGYISSKKELIIIPGGKLLSLPFELIISEKSAETNFNSQRFLIRDYTISYHYSATLGFDPKYQKKNAAWKDCFTGFAPSFDENSKPYGGKRLSELLYNEAEVRQISELFQQNNRKSQIFTGALASEINFKSLEDCRYIHIATHSIANEENPELSALYFSNSFNDSTQDNILYADELFNVKLNAELIVLSSCETGTGKLVNGEGVIALTRGLIYNGIPNLLFSLWEVSDRTTSMLMVEFYKNILEGKSYRAALRDSKLKMLTNDFTAFPDKWGAFVLIGN